jgi:hypothetical protein
MTNHYTVKLYYDMLSNGNGNRLKTPPPNIFAGHVLER